MEVFVFGSNLAGRHGRGAARHALKHHHAVYGRGEGLQGNSYAIPTKDHKLQILPLPSIEFYVQRFLFFCNANTFMDFNVTCVGCGLAGYKHESIAPFFRPALSMCHVHLPPEFRAVLMPVTKVTWFKL